MSEFTLFNKIVVDIVLFIKGESKNKSLFITVMSEKNTDNIDLFFLIMESNFNLGNKNSILTLLFALNHSDEKVRFYSLKTI